MNSFGVKTSLSKADKSYLAKKSKSDLINEALLLNLMVDETLTKSQILNQIKKYKQSIEKETKKKYDMQDLLKALPDISVPSVPSVKQPNMYDKYRESDILYYPEFKSYRLAPSSKVIRKEEGLTKTQKTQIRKEIKNEIDRLADLLEQFN